MTTKTKKIIFGIFYFGFFIILGLLAIQFLFTADYNKNAIEVAGLRWVGNSIGSWDGRSQSVPPLIVAIMFLVGCVSSFVIFLSSPNNRKGMNLGLIISGVLLLGFFVSIFRYFSQASLFDFIF